MRFPIISILLILAQNNALYTQEPDRQAMVDIGFVMWGDYRSNYQTFLSQEEALGSMFKKIKERSDYTNAGGLSIGFYPYRLNYGIEGSIFMQDSLWVILRQEDCLKYSTKERCENQLADLLFDHWGFTLGPTFRLLQGKLSETIIWNMHASLGLYYHTIEFTKTAEHLQSKSIDKLESLRWYGKITGTLYTQWVSQPGLYLRLGIIMKESTITLPETTTPLSGTHYKVVFEIGIAL